MPCIIHHHWWLYFLLFTVVCSVSYGYPVWYRSGVSACPSDACYCTRSPVTITCEGSDTRDLPAAIKEQAVVIRINGDELKDVLDLDFSQFMSLKNVFIDINARGVCSWINRQRKTNKNIAINSIDKDCVERKEEEMITTPSTMPHTGRDRDVRDKKQNNGPNSWTILTTIGVICIILASVYMMSKKIR